MAFRLASFFSFSTFGRWLRQRRQRAATQCEALRRLHEVTLSAPETLAYGAAWQPKSVLFMLSPHFSADIVNDVELVWQDAAKRTLTASGRYLGSAAPVPLGECMVDRPMYVFDVKVSMLQAPVFVNVVTCDRGVYAYLLSNPSRWTSPVPMFKVSR